MTGCYSGVQLSHDHCINVMTEDGLNELSFMANVIELSHFLDPQYHKHEMPDVEIMERENISNIWHQFKAAFIHNEYLLIDGTECNPKGLFDTSLISCANMLIKYKKKFKEVDPNFTHSQLHSRIKGYFKLHYPDLLPKLIEELCGELKSPFLQWKGPSFTVVSRTSSMEKSIYIYILSNTHL